MVLQFIRKDLIASLERTQSMRQLIKSWMDVMDDQLKHIKKSPQIGVIESINILLIVI